MRFDATSFVPGRACGHVVRLQAPLSFWGGFDLGTGRICDRTHPDCGTLLSGAILVMRSGRGSSSSSSVLAEAIRLGNAPAGFALQQGDPILGVGALAASAMYETTTPIVILSPDNFARLESGMQMRMEAGPLETGAIAFIESEISCHHR